MPKTIKVEMKLRCKEAKQLLTAALPQRYPHSSVLL